MGPFEDVCVATNAVLYRRKEWGNYHHHTLGNTFFIMVTDV